VPDARADRRDDARAFAAEPARQRERIEARAVIDVDEVHADRAVRNTRLTFAGRRDLDLAVLQNFGAAEGFETDGMCHDI
jgi:hypothetical protein